MEITHHTLKQPMVKWNIMKEIRKYFEVNENENTTYTNLKDFIVKAVLIERFIAVMTYS